MDRRPARDEPQRVELGRVRGADGGVEEGSLPRADDPAHAVRRAPRADDQLGLLDDGRERAIVVGADRLERGEQAGRADELVRVPPERRARQLRSFVSWLDSFLTNSLRTAKRASAVSLSWLNEWLNAPFRLRLKSRTSVRFRSCVSITK